MTTPKVDSNPEADKYQSCSHGGRLVLSLPKPGDIFQQPNERLVRNNLHLLVAGPQNSQIKTYGCVSRKGISAVVGDSGGAQLPVDSKHSCKVILGADNRINTKGVHKIA